MSIKEEVLLVTGAGVVMPAGDGVHPAEDDCDTLANQAVTMFPHLQPVWSP